MSSEQSLWIGAILGVIAIMLAVVGFIGRRRRLAMLDTPTLTCAQAADQIGATGAPVVCEVVGTTQPGGQGPLTSPFTKTPCVWFEVEVTRHYRTTTRDSKGRTRTTSRSERIEHFRTQHAFGVHDPTGAIVVIPAEAHVDHPHQTLSRRMGEGAGQAFYHQVTGRHLRGGFRTYAYSFRETVIPPGRPLYALGQAHAQGGGLELRPPAEGPHLISLRGEQAFAKSMMIRQYVGFGGTAVCAVAAIAVLLVGVLVPA
ncbi:MAG: hypothetical protein GEV11_26765 [Streptosporangiales bacterium]|nr:hypothetical protein [Streptosporangiales bacterium]